MLGVIVVLVLGLLMVLVVVDYLDLRVFLVLVFVG